MVKKVKEVRKIEKNGGKGRNKNQARCPIRHPIEGIRCFIIFQGVEVNGTINICRKKNVGATIGDQM